uniref:Sulfhydryl oxidase n=1 Tax=Marseillevirus LCMAC201 TaxID=2506605 RepID=A0A481YW45_9VIRU|nr:MAG: Erv1/Alr family disulfide (thiol) oxidoreductase [Marseillevirus LCMAC201]
MSLSNSYWGESIWRTLYTIAYTYPEDPADEMQRYTNTLYETIGHLLPCEECKKHYFSFLEQHPVQQATTRSTLLSWVNSLHNSVNQKLELPTELLSVRIAAMDIHNPTIPTTVQVPTVQAPTVQVPTVQAPTVQVPTVQAPKKSRRTGVSYSMKKVAVVDSTRTVGANGSATYPTTHQSSPLDLEHDFNPEPTQPHRQKTTVSYGMRRSRNIAERIGGCAGCSQKK